MEPEAFKCVIVADDLTGACDTAVRFATHGEVRVSMEPLGDTDTPPAADGPPMVFTALNTESRLLPTAEAAAECVRRWCRPLASGPVLVYKKVDSTLRGYMAAEVLACMEVFDVPLAIFCPAWPAAGRIVVGGYHLVHGTPIAQTDFGANKSPEGVTQSHLPTLLKQTIPAGVDCRIIHVPLHVVEQGAVAVCSNLGEALAREPAGRTIAVLDACQDKDLDCIARTSAQLQPHRPFLCGSSGLASAVERTFPFVATDRSDPPAAVTRTGPVLVAVGTGQETTAAQIEALKAATLGGLRVQQCSWQYPPEDTPDRFDVVVITGNPPQCPVSATPRGCAAVNEARIAAAEEVGHVADVSTQKAVLWNSRGVVATGGWTASEVLRRLKVSTLLVQSQGTDGSGAVRCMMHGGDLHGSPLVLKGGSLGGPDALLDVVKGLHSADSPLPFGIAPSGIRPLLAITMGDPCGVGPEIIAKAFSRQEVFATARPVVIGHPHFIRECARFVTGLVVREVTDVEGCEFTPRVVNVINPVPVDLEQVITGVVCPEAGRVSVEWVKYSVKLAMDGKVDAIVTAPLNKEAFNKGGCHYAGHTELLAEETGAKGSRLALVSDKLKVVHVTGHIGVKDIAAKMTEQKLYDTIEMAHKFMQRTGVPRPRLAVCGLNPHASDGGLFGDEEERVQRPAIERARAQGWDVTDPLPCDTLFIKATQGRYDMVLAMYHDQGHIPAKLVGFGDAVNVTLGLPILRTSVDHGTAFDIAGKGIADDGNMFQAIRYAANLSRHSAKA